MMLLYRGWIETRIRFLFSLPAILFICAASQSRYADYLANRSAGHISEWNVLTKQVAGTLQPGYESYLWLTWTAGTAIMILPMIANAIASAGIVPHGGCIRGRGRIEPSATAFALTLPVRRAELLMWTAAAGMLEVASIAFGSQLFSVFVAAWQGAQYAIGTAIVFALIQTAACFLPFAAGLVLTALIDDDTTSRLAGMIPILAIFMVSANFEWSLPLAYYRVLSGISYLTTGAIPWTGLAVCVIIGGMLVWLAAQLVERRDY